MKVTMVTTNVRMTKAEWQQAKIAAAGAGLSLNAYIKKLLVETTSKTFLGAGAGKSKKSNKVKRLEKLTIWDLPKLARAWKPMAESDLSDEDKAIYSV